MDGENLQEGKAVRRGFSDLAASIRKGRGPNKNPTKKLVSLRLSPDVLEHFKSKGPGWQGKIDEALRKVAGVRR
jgi:uncharacterized protein (DUF4415 family)